MFAIKLLQKVYPNLAKKVTMFTIVFEKLLDNVLGISRKYNIENVDIAFVICIWYENTNFWLPGCKNDLIIVHNYLKNVRKCNNILFLLEDKATRNNILIYLEKYKQEIYRLCKQKKSVTAYFHYSGHGLQIPDQSNDEEDGLDECFVPIDYNTSGVVKDDIIYQKFIKYVKNIPNLHLRIFIDCCHSGTIIEGIKGAKADIAIISGCQDSEKAVEMKIDDLDQGACTAALNYCLDVKKHTKVRSIHLLNDIREYFIKYGVKQNAKLTTSINHRYW